MTERVFSTICPVCLSFLHKVNRRTYECSTCGNWMYMYLDVDLYTKEAWIMYRSDIEAPADFYPKSRDIFPGYCKECGEHYPYCRKYCTILE